MQLVLSEAVAFFLVPSNVIAFLTVLGLVLVIFRRPSGANVAAVAAAALVTAALSPLGNMLLVPLEQRFPDMRFPEQEIDGIIALGGSYDSQSHAYLSAILLEEDTEPVAVMADLARHYARAQIIFSGGSEPSTPGPSEAAIVKQFFVSFGIAADRITIEGRSLTTEENARFTAQLIHPMPSSRWLLVTSAYHMPRAIGSFRKAGFDVVAFSVGLRTHGWHELWRPATTATDNLRRGSACSSIGFQDTPTNGSLDLDASRVSGSAMSAGHAKCWSASAQFAARYAAITTLDISCELDLLIA
jgi:uncharacterized SAM-binding protein YcdF (DUF218 family)